MWPFRSKKRKKHEAEALASTLAAFAPLLGVQQEAPEIDAALTGMLLYSGAVGIVVSGAASYLLPGQIVEPALLGGSAALLPPAASWLVDRSHVLIEVLASAKSGLEEKRTKRTIAELEARQAAQQAGKAAWEARERVLLLRVNEAQALERGAKRATGSNDALRAEHEKRGKLRAMLHATYDEHSADAPKRWQGGQPFGKGALCERFGKQDGARIHSKLLDLGAVLPNGTMPQWNYALVGHTAEEAQRWLEARGVFNA